MDVSRLVINLIDQHNGNLVKIAKAKLVIKKGFVLVAKPKYKSRKPKKC